MILFPGWPVKNQNAQITSICRDLQHFFVPLRHLVLASTSPYRRELLSRLGMPFDVAAPGCDETPLPGEPPSATATRLAHAKSRAVIQLYTDALCIGSDQVAILGDRPVGKPGNHENALRQLMSMAGRSVVFHTALCVTDATSGRSSAATVPTTVWFRPYSEAEADTYLHREKPYDCAGSAKIEGMGILLVEKVESEDPTALIGLPLIALSRLLREFGVSPL